MNSLRVPLLPLLAAVLNAAQLSVEPLKGAVGPTPPLIGLKFAPVPRGIAKQLVQPVPKLALVPVNKPSEAG